MIISVTITIKNDSVFMIEDNWEIRSPNCPQKKKNAGFCYLPKVF